MRFLRKMRFVLPQRAELSGLLDLAVNRSRCALRMTGSSASTSLPPFAPRPLRRFNTTMKALTPARVSHSYRSPCFTHIAFRTIPSPTTWRPLSSLYTCYIVLSATDFLSLRPFADCFSGAGHRQNRSRLRHCIAGSPDTHGRNGFVILRTGRSPPVASHPASRRRSYPAPRGTTGCRVHPKGTCTPLTICAHRRTIPTSAGTT